MTQTFQLTTALRLTTALALALGLTACSENKLGGDIEVNGQKSAVTSCRTGQIAGGTFAEVANASGFRVRVVQRTVPTTAGSSSTKSETTFEAQLANAAQPVVAKCGTTSSSNKTINGRLSGGATIANCTIPGANFSAKFTYGGCT